MTYDESVRYLLTLGRELASPQQARAAKFDLENITALAESLGHPERAVPSAHVAGTNGKGSTAAMLSSILRAAGLRAGLYTSPHLVRINERIALLVWEASDRSGCNRPGSRIDPSISDADFASIFTRVHTVIERLLASGRLAAHPTYFECVTAMAFEFFASRQVDIAVFEVGLGGRLDSTNVIVPEVAVITPIDFDHENFLGHSIEQIAGEKAGIIKRGAWVVSAVENPAAREVIRRRVADQNARLVEIDKDYRVSDVRTEDGCYRFVARRSERDGGNADGLEVSLPLAGRFQVRNALTAIAAAHLLAERGFAVTDDAMVHGLATVHWRGRLERLQQRPDVYLDGTHNPAGARELVSFWNEQMAGRRIYLVYGAMRDKAVDEVAGLLFPRAATVILTQSPQPRAISADALAAMTRHFASAVEVIPDAASALRRAMELATPEDVVFATGSLFLVGDLLRYWEAHREGARKAPTL